MALAETPLAKALLQWHLAKSYYHHCCIDFMVSRKQNKYQQNMEKYVHLAKVMLMVYLLSIKSQSVTVEDMDHGTVLEINGIYKGVFIG